MTPLEIFQEFVEEKSIDSIDQLLLALCRNDQWMCDELTDQMLQANGYEHLDEDGGGEGGAEDCYGVFRWNGTIYRAEFTYMSHYGYETWGIQSSLREVKPVERMVTFYE